MVPVWIEKKKNNKLETKKEILTTYVSTYLKFGSYRAIGVGLFLLLPFQPSTIVVLSN